MNINQRGAGNTNILKEIQQASKQVSQDLGISEAVRIFPEQPKVDESKLGAAASLGLNKPQVQPLSHDIADMFSYMPTQGQRNTTQSNESTTMLGFTGNSGTVKFDLTKSALNRLIDDIDTLKDTKEYFNALQSLLSLYALGYLDSGILDRMSREDLKELRGIVREFKSILDEY